MNIPGNYIVKELPYAPNHGIAYTDSSAARQADEKSKFKVQQNEKTEENQAKKSTEDEIQMYSKSASMDNNGSRKGQSVDYFV